VSDPQPLKEQIPMLNLSSTTNQGAGKNEVERKFVRRPGRSRPVLAGLVRTTRVARWIVMLATFIDDVIALSYLLVPYNSCSCIGEINYGLVTKRSTVIGGSWLLAFDVKRSDKQIKAKLRDIATSKLSLE
jgi:hypothetical protein